MFIYVYLQFKSEFKENDLALIFLYITENPFNTHIDNIEMESTHKDFKVKCKNKFNEKRTHLNIQV